MWRLTNCSKSKGKVNRSKGREITFVEGTIENRDISSKGIPLYKTTPFPQKINN